MSKLKWFSSRLPVVCAQSTEAKCWVDNEDVVGAAPTGDAPTTSELSTILSPTKVPLILETWWYIMGQTKTKKNQIKNVWMYLLLSLKKFSMLRVKAKNVFIV